jgi:protein-ribulosamine 3-kinase
MRQAIERLVASHLGRRWTITATTDLKDLASHPAYLFSDGDYTVFVKLSDAPNGMEQFEVEVAGARRLRERAGVATPTPLGTLTVDGAAVLVLEAVPAVARGPREWRAIGQTLAKLHAVQWDRCGLETQGFFGPLPLDNRPEPDWPTFYVERRLQPFFELAVAAGRLPAALARQVEHVIARVPALSGPPVTPALLHGDAQHNNFITTAAGVVAVDCAAVHYGHPEYDLANVDYFEPVPADVFDGYRAVRPIDPGFAERRHLWRLAAHLAVVSVGGPAYLPPLAEAVQAYL